VLFNRVPHRQSGNGREFGKTCQEKMCQEKMKSRANEMKRRIRCVSTFRAPLKIPALDRIQKGSILCVFIFSISPLMLHRPPSLPPSSTPNTYSTKSNNSTLPAILRAAQTQRTHPLRNLSPHSQQSPQKIAQ